MPDTKTHEPNLSTLSDFWKTRYQRQKLLISSIMSLLNRYGGSLDISGLRSAFVLTLMGHYVVGDACYYAMSEDESELIATHAYGRVRTDTLPALPVESTLVRHLSDNATTTLLKSLTLSPDSDEATLFLTEHYRVVTPLLVNQRMLGIVMLGETVAGQSFRDFDFDVLNALGAVSATTFNNAMLYRNARYGVEEIKRLYDLRTEIIGRISHEFRTPLTVIKGALNAVDKGADVAPWKELVTSSAERLEELINSLLELNDDAEPGTASSCDPAPAIHVAMERLSERAQQKSVSFALSQDALAEGQFVGTSRSNLIVAVQAILDNALTYSPENSCVNIDTFVRSQGPCAEDGVAFLDWHEQTEHLLNSYLGIIPGPEAAVSTRNRGRESSAQRFFVMRVSDVGIGIPSEEIQFIYEPFRQASNSPNHGVKGRGLGLALVYKIVRQAGGHLCCRSEQGKGATFLMFLPTF